VTSPIRATRGSRAVIIAGLEVAMTDPERKTNPRAGGGGRAVHDLGGLAGDPIDRAEFLRRVFDTLAPGGIFGVIDHHAEAGSGDRDALDPGDGLHRIDAELVMAEILAAGFVLDAESDLLKNPDDTRDWNIFADDAARRDKTDRFVWKFVKPAE